MKTLVCAFSCFALLACVSPSVAQPQPAQALPEWWSKHVTLMSRDGGVWQTPNPPGANDPSVPDAFGMEWRSVNEGHGLVGRLYGLEGGCETLEFWTFREFWHPGEQRAIVQQWGGPGVFGHGESRWENEEGVLDQTFWLPDGRSWREGHRTREADDAYFTDVYDIDANGGWTLRNSNTWRRTSGQGDQC